MGRARWVVRCVFGRRSSSLENGRYLRVSWLEWVRRPLILVIYMNVVGMSNRESDRSLLYQAVVRRIAFRVGAGFQYRTAKKFLISQRLISWPTQWPAYKAFVRDLYIAIQTGGPNFGKSRAEEMISTMTGWGFSADVLRSLAALQGINLTD